MPQQRRTVQLTKAERGTLATVVAHGKRRARAITRARIRLLSDAGRKERELPQLLGVSRGTVSTVRQKDHTTARAHILDLLPEEPRRGRPVEFDSRVEAQLAMLACSAPPAGGGKWRLQLSADRLVKLEVTDSSSSGSVRRLLKKPTLSRG
jgi:transposase